LERGEKRPSASGAGRPVRRRPSRRFARRRIPLQTCMTPSGAVPPARNGAVMATVARPMRAVSCRAVLPATAVLVARVTIGSDVQDLQLCGGLAAASRFPARAQGAVVALELLASRHHRRRRCNGSVMFCCKSLLRPGRKERVRERARAGGGAATPMSVEASDTWEADCRESGIERDAKSGEGRRARGVRAKHWVVTRFWAVCAGLGIGSEGRHAASRPQESYRWCQRDTLGAGGPGNSSSWRCPTRPQATCAA